MKASHNELELVCEFILGCKALGLVLRKNKVPNNPLQATNKASIFEELKGPTTPDRRLLVLNECWIQRYEWGQKKKKKKKKNKMHSENADTSTSVTFDLEL